jgi:hypothetical protein
MESFTDFARTGTFKLAVIASLICLGNVPFHRLYEVCTITEANERESARERVGSQKKDNLPLTSPLSLVSSPRAASR